MKQCTEIDKKIQILLSTYNGEKYIEEQLDSFLKLEGFENIKILIRDDGSTDKTVRILKDYSRKYDFEMVEGENLGVNGSVYWLFTHCDLSCDFFALSDQDDVWLPHKFTSALNKLSRFDNRIPLLFASCSQITDEFLNPIGRSLVPKKGVSFYNAMIQNVCPGHTQVFNRALMLELNKIDVRRTHVIDSWVYLTASAIGQVIFDEQITVLHRQHGNNSVGYELSFRKTLVKRLKRLNLSGADPIAVQLEAFYECYKDRLSNDYSQEIKHFITDQENLLTRFGYALKGNAFRQTLIETIIFKGLYILGKFKLLEE